MGAPVVHFEVVGKDGAALQSFYADLFDWKVDANNPMNYGMVDTQSGQGIGGGISGGAEDGPGHVTVYVQVDDAQAALDKAVSLGASVVMPVMDVPDGPTIALFADPEGHVVGIVKGM